MKTIHLMAEDTIRDDRACVCGFGIDAAYDRQDDEWYKKILGFAKILRSIAGTLFLDV
jgi:hypothetical protein